MTNTHDVLRERILMRLHVREEEPETRSHEAVEAAEWSSQFEQLMRNRLVVGRFRYGPLANKMDRGVFESIPSAINRLIKYLDDGNLEHLVDAANLCMVEFEKGRHPKRHFKATDDGPHVERRR